MFGRSTFAIAFLALVGCTPTNGTTPLALPLTTPTSVEITAASPTVGATATSGVDFPTPTRALSAVDKSSSTRISKPEIISFSVSPTTTTALGQNILLEWQAKGEKAEVCGLAESGLTGCLSLPISGRTNYVTKDSSVTYPALVLRVSTNDESTTASVPVRLCADATPWFFVPAPARCAQGVNQGRGAAQNFERGTMVWIPLPDMFLVFYADAQQTFQQIQARYSFKPGASPDNRVGGAPKGLVEPVSGFGQIWRGEIRGADNVRQNLGWATAPEFEFDAAYQCAMTSGLLWSCYLRDARGQIIWLRPNSTAGTSLLWSVVPGK